MNACGELGKELAYSSSAGCLWEAYSLSEDWSGAEPMLHEAYGTLERMGEKFAPAGVAALLGEVAYRQRRLDEAERYCAISTEFGACEDPSFQALLRVLRAKVPVARGELRYGGGRTAGARPLRAEKAISSESRERRRCST